MEDDKIQDDVTEGGGVTAILEQKINQKARIFKINT